MKIYNIKHSVFDFISSVIAFIFCIFIISYINGTKEIVYIIISLFLTFLFFFYLIVSVKQIQWIIIESDCLVVKNVFGLVKKINYSKIKKAYIDNLKIYGAKGFIVRKQYIVLSTNKSLIKSNVQDAYNSKKNNYVVVPYNNISELEIKKVYKAYTGNELEF